MRSASERRHRWVAAVVLGSVVGVLLGSCAQEPDQLDPDSAERQIAGALAGVVAPPVAEVRCPAPVRLEEGGEFDCEVVLGAGGGTLPVRVVQRDDRGTLEVLPERAVLSARQVADELRSSLGETFGRSFQVDCGTEPATVREPGEQLICRARDQGSRRSVAVTIVDERGSLSFEISDP